MLCFWDTDERTRLTEGQGFCVLYESFHELLGVEQFEVVDFFAHADEYDGDFELAAQREHESPLRSSVQFGENDAVKVDRLVKDLCLIDGVLPRCGVEDEIF